MNFQSIAGALGVVVAVAAISASSPLLAQGEKPATSGPVATVNGVAIPRARAEALIRLSGQPNNEQVQAAIKQRLIDWELLSQEAARSGLTKTPDVQIQVDIARQQALANAYVNDYIRKHPVSEADLQAEYDKARSATGPKEYRARHILVATEEEATRLIAELKRGGKFEDLASKNSKDPGTKDRGGDLDWNSPGTFDKAFSDAMVKLDKGKMSEAPVRTRFGFHIIRLEDVRDAKFPAFAEVKPQIQQQLAQRKLDEQLKALRTKAKIE